MFFVNGIFFTNQFTIFFSRQKTIQTPLPFLYFGTTMNRQSSSSTEEASRIPNNNTRAHTRWQQVESPFKISDSVYSTRPTVKNFETYEKLSREEKNRTTLGVLHQMMGGMCTDTLDSTEKAELETSMAHAARIVNSVPDNLRPYTGSINMELLEELFYEDQEIYPFLQTPKVRDLLDLQFVYENYPDTEFDEARGKFDNETKEDIKRRYTPVVQKIIQFPYTSPLKL